MEQQCLSCPIQLFRSGTAQGCSSRREVGGDSGSFSVCHRPSSRKEGGPFSTLHYSQLGPAEALAVTHIFFLRRQSKKSQFSSLLASLRVLWAVLGGGEAYCVDASQNLLGGGRLLSASSHLPHRCSPQPPPSPL